MALFKSSTQAKACRPLPTLDTEQTARYRRFRRLLEHNRTALTLQSELEQLYYDNRPIVPQVVERKVQQLLLEVDGMVNALAGMTGRQYPAMHALINEIGRSLAEEWAVKGDSAIGPLVLPLAEAGRERAGEVGAKAANLALVRRELGLPTPDGFAVTTAASRRFFRETGLAAEIDELLAQLAGDDPAGLVAVSEEISGRIRKTSLPAAIGQALAEAVRRFPPEARLAVRSSAIGEDGDISFAGQYTSVLNVVPADLEQAYLRVVASSYSPSALSYRMHHGLDDRETPMAVLVLAMVQPKWSGVLYTADPTGSDRSSIRISAVAGLGDSLVGGDTSPEQAFRIDKTSFAVLESGGGEEAVDQAMLAEIAQAAVRMEAHYRRPLDIEWAVDENDRLVVLQVRPLLVLAEEEAKREAALDYPEHPLLLEGGTCAAGGAVAGRVKFLDRPGTGDGSTPVDSETIIVARTAAISLTPWVSKVRGIITDIGSAASHLASVAREFGVPALFDTGLATATLKEGEEVTLWANRGRVYQGRVRELLQTGQQMRRPIVGSPAALRLQHLLDRVSPLNLIDPASPDFAPERCRSVHDIIRYCHELSVRTMFTFGEQISRLNNAVRLKVNIPIVLFALDLGGGLRPGLTTCDEISVHEVACIPFTALWRGFSHPGINWTSAVAVGATDFLSLMAAGARPMADSGLGRASYAILAGDYMNLSIRFGYHFATVDVLCGPEPEHNHLTLSFAGGAGAYHGRSLRIQFLAGVLDRLGFATAIKGDLLEASLLRLDQAAMEAALDQLGRLLGASRLLDMALKSPEQMSALTEAFFRGAYNFLEPERPDAPAGFYLITGEWKNSGPDGEPGIFQDGSAFASPLSAGLSRSMGHLFGSRYQEFLDNIEAYCYFPLLIARESAMGDGVAQVEVKPLAGSIDQAGGLAFAIRDWSNYFVLRINALEGNAVLFEFRNGKRFKRQSAPVPIRLGQWHLLRVEIAGRRIGATVDGLPVAEWVADRDLAGSLGLWTKADSVTLFRGLLGRTAGGEKRLMP